MSTNNYNEYIDDLSTQSKSQLLDLMNELPTSFQSEFFIDQYDMELESNLDEIHPQHQHRHISLQNVQGLIQHGTDSFHSTFSNELSQDLNSIDVNPINSPLLLHPDQTQTHLHPHPHTHTLNSNDTANLLQTEQFTPNEILLFDVENELNYAEFLTSDPSNISIVNSYFPNSSNFSNHFTPSNFSNISNSDLFTKNTNVYIRLVEGFINPPKERQPGGRDNMKHPLPVHTIKLLTDLLPSNVDIYDLTVIASVMGFDKDKSNKLLLGNAIDERKFIHQDNEYLAKFDNLIVKFSSHLHGAKLFIRFTLQDAQKQDICYVDAQPFSTITKRGIEKRKERGGKRKRMDSEDERPTQRLKIESIINEVDPPCGPCQGGLMARLRGESIFVTPESRLAVRFGNNLSPEIVSVNRNGIVCEIPPSPSPGLVPVTVETGADQPPIKSNATYKYINQNSMNDVQELLQVMFRGRLHITTPNNENNNERNSMYPMQSFESYSINQTTQQSFNNDINLLSNLSIQSHNSDNQMSKRKLKKFIAFSVPTLDSEIFDRFIYGEFSDPCGFNILHHAAARGYSELISYLANEYIEDIDPVDNFGRTPFLWSIQEGHIETALTLYELGCNLYHRDLANDNFLHIATRTNLAETLETILKSILKNDDNVFTLTEKLIEMIYHENDNGDTPLSISHEYKEMEYLLKSFETQRNAIKNESFIFNMDEITLRSGDDNSKKLSSLGYSGLKLSIESDRFIIYFNYNNLLHKSIIQFSTIAFLIVSSPNSRIELTLKESPSVYQSNNRKNWNLSQNNIHLSKTLSFFMMIPSDKIEDILPFIKKQSCLNEFLPGSFHFVTSEQIAKNSKGSTNTFETKSSTSPKLLGKENNKKKFGTIEKKLTKIHPILKNVTSETEEQHIYLIRDDQKNL